MEIATDFRDVFMITFENLDGSILFESVDESVDALSIHIEILLDMERGIRDDISGIDFRIRFTAHPEDASKRIGLAGMIHELCKDDGIARCFTQALLAPILVVILSSPEIGPKGASILALLLRVRGRVVRRIVDEERQEGVDERRLAAAVVPHKDGRLSLRELE